MATVESIVRTGDQSSGEQVSVGTWLRFIVGGREAILKIAGSPQALWLGLLFVLSTGFAREYDGADLRSEPWHLALPLVASLGTSLILWSLVYVAARSRGLEDLSFWSGYRTLLTFYWMTAPLAWIYAIPVERFMSPGDATAMNLWLLAGVSVWRVLLITRALSVWLSAPIVVIFLLVMFFADSMAVALAYITPAPIFNIMGGVRMSDQDRILSAVTFNVMVLGMLSWLGWLAAAAIAYAVARLPWKMATGPGGSTKVSPSLWILSAILLLTGFALLPIGQPEQQRAHQAAALLQSNDVAGAVGYMAEFSRDAFPPVWDPPPRIGYYEERPDVVDVLAEIERQKAPRWIAELYLSKVAISPRRALAGASAEKFGAVLSVLEKHISVDTLDDLQIYDLRQIALDPRTSREHSDRLKAYLGDRLNL